MLGHFVRYTWILQLQIHLKYTKNFLTQVYFLFFFLKPIFSDQSISCQWQIRDGYIQNLAG